MVESAKKFLRKVPIPICGLILGMVSLGNLLYSFGYATIGTIYCVLGSLLMILVILKIIFTMKHALSTLDDPIIASVSPTFTMALMVICVFLDRIFTNAVWINVLWIGAVILHFILMIYFVAVHIFPTKIELEHIYPSWFITFVGIGVIPNTSQLFINELGKIVFWVALFFYLLLLPILIKRITKSKEMPESTIPLLTIMTAPGSLCLAGYISMGGHLYMPLVVFLLILSQCIYGIVVVNLYKIMQVTFYPSYAAFTFPLVISATALVKVKPLFAEKVGLTSLLNILSTFELLLAVAIVSYVFIRYCIFLFQRENNTKKVELN